MSNFSRVAWHPKERRARLANWMDNYFDHYVYGVQFPGDSHVYKINEVEFPTDLILVPETKEEGK